MGMLIKMFRRVESRRMMVVHVLCVVVVFLSDRSKPTRLAVPFTEVLPSTVFLASIRTDITNARAMLPAIFLIGIFATLRIKIYPAYISFPANNSLQDFLIAHIDADL